MKNIHVLPTSQPSRLWINSIDSKLVLDDEAAELNSVNIYITSNESLNIGGYHFNSKYWDEPQKTNQRDIDSRKYWEEEHYIIQKIILTTDQDLIKDGIQAIDDEFLEWFVKNPNCEFVYVIFNNRGITTSEKILKTFGEYKIIIPKEEITLEDIFNDKKKEGLKEFIDKQKQETIEEAADKKIIKIGYKSDKQYYKFFDLIQFGVKWKERRMYNDMEEYAEFILRSHNEKLPLINAKDWFKQFKNR